MGRFSSVRRALRRVLAPSDEKRPGSCDRARPAPLHQLEFPGEALRNSEKAVLSAMNFDLALRPLLAQRDLTVQEMLDVRRLTVEKRRLLAQHLELSNRLAEQPQPGDEGATIPTLTSVPTYDEIRDATDAIQTHLENLAAP